MITSVRNQQVQRARKLSKRGVRDRTGEFLLEGASGIAEALATRARIEMLFVDPSAGERGEELGKLAAARKVPVLEVSERVMESIADTSTPQGVLALCKFRDLPAAQLLSSPFTFAIVLAGVRDPGNAGTILRTARAAGVDGVFMSSDSADLYNPKVVRATAGALFHMPVAREVDIPWLMQELGTKGVSRIGTDAGGSIRYDAIDAAGRLALVFGNEAWGLTEDVARHVDVTASIPLAGGSESLNVGVAAAIFMFEVARQRSLA